MLFMFLAIIALVGYNVSAQGTRGTIRGIVSDGNKAAIPNASVRLVDAVKGTESVTQTSSNGTYQFLEVDPAIYYIVVNASGFSDSRINEIKVEPNRNLVLDVAMAVGTVTNEVTVTAGDELIDRESATLGTTVDRKRVEGLPLDGRNILSLALLQPGVAPTAGTLSGTGIRVNGNRGVENNIQLDGANNNEVAVGGTIGAQPRPDAVQEFRLLTSNFEPEFGRNTGAIINVVTRSGANRFFGNGRFFYRPTELSAANFLTKALAGTTGRAGQDVREPFDRKEYGFNVGGPIYFLNFGEGVPSIYDGKDKSFFFVDYERRWQNRGASSTVSGIPTLAERQGNFSGSGSTIYDPLTATAANPGGNPFPGNVIPTNRISPIAAYYNQFLPTPNASGQAQVGNDTLTINNYFTLRLDHNITNDHLLNFTYNYFDSDAAAGLAFGGTNFPGFGATDKRATDNYVGRYTYVMTSNLINNFLVSYSRNDQPSVAPVNKTTPAQIGFTANFVADAQFAGPPRISFYDRGIFLGNTIQGPQARITENIQFQDSVSWLVGSHRMKFGVDFVKYKQNTNFLFINQGIFGYSAVGEPGSNSVGDDYADFLLGTSPLTAQFGSAGVRDYRQKGYAAFAQDSWRATRNLTLSYGVRYEYTSPLKDLQNRVAYYRPGSVSQQLIAGTLSYDGRRIALPAGGRAPNGLVYVGDQDNVLGGTVPEGGVALDKNNFAPRVGLAYSVNMGEGFLGRLAGKDKTVFRAGFGMYYGAIVGDTALQQLSAPGFNGTNAYFYRASGTLADPFAPDPYPLYSYLGGPKDVPTSIPNPFTSTSDILVGLTAAAPRLTQFSQPIDPNIETPEVFQWNVTVERSFARDYVIGLSYVGSRGHKLYIREAVNPSVGTLLPASLRPQVTPTPTVGNVNSRRLNNDISVALNQLTSGGNSQFDAFQVNFQKRFSDGFQFQAAYTFSKSLSDADTQRGQLDLLDRSAGWGLSSDDHPHRFVVSGIYELPFFKQTKGIVNRIVDGWSLGLIYTYQSGDVFSVANPTDTDGTGGAIVNFADLGSPYQTMDPKKNDRRAFNIDAFRRIDCTGGFVSGPCAGGRRGTSGKNQFRLNNITNNWDAVLAKKIKLFSETNNLELRFEAFNLLNTVRFTGVNLSPTALNITNGNFGRYTSADQGRSVQLGARLNF